MNIISFLSLVGVIFESPDMYIPLGIPKKVRKLVKGFGVDFREEELE